MAKKRYSSVVEMARELTEDDAFADDLAQRLDRKRVVRTLLALRAAKNLSQKDIADRMGCTRGRISKLESSIDDDLRLGDLEAYTKALGLNVTLVLDRKGFTRTLEYYLEYFAT
jgi:DNA-binding Xre family transcriptional regulator